MFNMLMRTFFGCTHNRTTFPLTPSRNAKLSDGTRKHTYVVCLDCGGEFEYNWKEMRIGDPIQKLRIPPATVHAEQPAIH